MRGRSLSDYYDQREKDDTDFKDYTLKSHFICFLFLCEACHTISGEAQSDYDVLLTCEGKLSSIMIVG